ncbi:MAG: hypothetical protein DME14_02555 [Candidatus Rokuibacteriota bacterium]|nr:MAG: hypothetical protein DME14_02555 [Candidatus Rokubacteria bacterium]
MSRPRGPRWNEGRRAERSWGAPCLRPPSVKRSSAQITAHYRAEELIGRQVIAVVNFPPKQVGPFVSEVLVLGAYDEGGEVILLRPDQAVGPGSKIG